MKLIISIIIFNFIACNNNPSDNSNNIPVNPDYDLLIGSWVFQEQGRIEYRFTFNSCCQTFFTGATIKEFHGNWFLKQDTLVFNNNKIVENTYDSQDSLLSTDTTSEFMIVYKNNYEIIDTNHWAYYLEGIGWYDYYRIIQ